MDKNIFKNRLNQLGISRQVDAAMIVANAQQIIEEHFGKDRATNHIRVVSYKNGILKIATTSSAWAAEVQKLKPELETGEIKRIIFRTSNLENFEFPRE